MVKDFLKKHEYLIVIALIVIGALLRLLWLDSLPAGFNQDEASAGYDAWAILNYGIDRNGNSMPVLLEAWGSGQNALYSYLSMPFIALFGLSVWSFRLTGALVGIITLVVFWLLAKRCRGVLFGLTALLFLVVNPWHIMASRWALESNLLPFFLLLGIYLTSVAADRHWALIGAAASFGLAVYAYGTAFFFLPFFLVPAVIWLAKNKNLRLPSFLTSFVLFVLLAFPVAYCQLINMLGYSKDVTILGFTLPILTEGRQSATSIFGGGGLSTAFDNFRDFLKLLCTQSDGLPYNSTDTWGLYYVFGLPLLVVGIYAAFKERREAKREFPMLVALGVSVLCAFFISININRINMAWLPVMYFCALGLHFILLRLGRHFHAPVTVLALCGVVFFGSYFYEFKTEGYSGFFPGLGDAICYTGELDADSIFLSTDSINQPYIYVLFYTQTPPQEFIDTVVYTYPDAAFRPVSSFGKYSFGTPSSAEADILILHESEIYGYTVLAQFGVYCVCK